MARRIAGGAIFVLQFAIIFVVFAWWIGYFSLDDCVRAESDGAFISPMCGFILAVKARLSDLVPGCDYYLNGICESCAASFEDVRYWHRCQFYWRLFAGWYTTLEFAPTAIALAFGMFPAAVVFEAPTYFYDGPSLRSYIWLAAQILFSAVFLVFTISVQSWAKSSRDLYMEWTFGDTIFTIYGLSLACVKFVWNWRVYFLAIISSYLCYTEGLVKGLLSPQLTAEFTVRSLEGRPPETKRYRYREAWAIKVLRKAGKSDSSLPFTEYPSGADVEELLREATIRESRAGNENTLLILRPGIFAKVLRTVIRPAFWFGFTRGAIIPEARHGVAPQMAVAPQCLVKVFSGGQERGQAFRIGDKGLTVLHVLKYSPTDVAAGTTEARLVHKDRTAPINILNAYGPSFDGTHLGEVVMFEWPSEFNDVKSIPVSAEDVMGQWLKLTKIPLGVFDKAFDTAYLARPRVDGTILYYFDTFKGDSGSVLTDANGVARGIHYGGGEHTGGCGIPFAETVCPGLIKDLKTEVPQLRRVLGRGKPIESKALKPESSDVTSSWGGCPWADQVHGNRFDVNASKKLFDPLWDDSPAVDLAGFEKVGVGEEPWAVKEPQRLANVIRQGPPVKQAPAGVKNKGLIPESEFFDLPEVVVEPMEGKIDDRIARLEKVVDQLKLEPEARKTELIDQSRLVSHLVEKVDDIQEQVGDLKIELASAVHKHVERETEGRLAKMDKQFEDLRKFIVDAMKQMQAKPESADRLPIPITCVCGESFGTPSNDEERVKLDQLKNNHMDGCVKALHQKIKLMQSSMQPKNLNSGDQSGGAPGSTQSPKALQKKRQRKAKKAGGQTSDLSPPQAPPSK